MRRFLSTLIFVFSVPAAVSAQEVNPINMEFPERPVVNSNRVTGMGGAYVGVAEGADGHLYNPASFASRFAYTRDDIWDYDWTLYWLNLPRNRHPDISGTDADSSYFGGGLDFKVAGFGAGLHLFGSSYAFERDGDAGPEAIELSESLVVFGFGYAFPLIDVVVGASLNVGSGSIVRDGGVALDTVGAGNNIGFLWMPRRFPLRIGINARYPILNDRIEETGTQEADFLPQGISVPGQLTFGASYMFWERKYNPRHTWGLKPLKKEETEWGRRYVLLAYDIVLTGTSPDAISVNSFLNEQFEASGTESQLSMRLGVESEFIANWVRLRTGYYPETSRVPGRPGRHHWTFGGDVKVPVLIDWRLNGAIDIAAGYLNIGVGVGFWH